MADFRYRLLPVFANLLPADRQMQAHIDKVREPHKAKLEESLAVTDGLFGAVLFAREVGLLEGVSAPRVAGAGRAEGLTLLEQLLHRDDAEVGGLERGLKRRVDLEPDVARLRGHQIELLERGAQVRALESCGRWRNHKSHLFLRGCAQAGTTSMMSPWAVAASSVRPMRVPEEWVATRPAAAASRVEPFVMAAWASKIGRAHV